MHYPLLKHSIGLPAIPCTMSEPTLGFFVPLPAQDGKSTDLKNFLLKGRELIDNEPLTLQWYAVEYTGDAYASTPTFAIFDTFAATEGLTAHKEGAVAAALGQNASSLLSGSPNIQVAEILASLVRKGEGKVGLRVLATAKADKVAEVEKFLKSAVPLVEAEPLTVQWFTFKLAGTNTFGIVDFFEGDEGRNAHLKGKVAEALFAKAEEFFESTPEVVLVNVVAGRVL